MCRVCKQIKQHDDFSRDASKKDGRSSQCKACYSIYYKQYLQRPGNRQRKLEYNHIFQNTPAAQETQKKRQNTSEYKQWAEGYQQEYRQRPDSRENKRTGSRAHPEWAIIGAARSRAKRAGVPCTVTIKDLEIPDKCPVLGLSLLRGKGIKTDSSPSFDRILPELGYVQGNIAIISERANRIKNNGTAEEHLKIADWMTGNGENLSQRPDGREIIPKDRKFIYRARRRARDKGIPFNLLPEDIWVPETCPILGIPLRYARGRMEDNSPSLDRINPEKGYVRGNIAIISYRANRMKADGTADEHRLIAEWIRRMTTQKGEEA